MRSTPSAVSPPAPAGATPLGRGLGRIQLDTPITLGSTTSADLLLRRPELVAGPLVAATATRVVRPPESGAVGTGWIDGALGLLVHTYRVGSDSELVDARITTLTAQSERWLATLLTSAVEAHPPTARSDLDRPPPGLIEAMEGAVREADPRHWT